MLGSVVAVSATRNAASRERRAAAEAARQSSLARARMTRRVTRLAVVPEAAAQGTPPAELRRRVANLQSGTYIADVLAEQDSVLYRWPDRLSEAIRVWIQPTSEVASWRPEYAEVARTVFGEWSAAGFPLTFTFIFDSTRADIAIRWIDRFPPESGQRIGETERSQTPASLISSARISAALHDSTGRVLSSTAVAGILRHEVGHALGLNHSNDRTSVMYREAATSVIGQSDRATLRLIYLVPAGSLR